MSSGEFGGWWRWECESEGGLWSWSGEVIGKEGEGRFGGVG